MRFEILQSQHNAKSSKLDGHETGDDGDGRQVLIRFVLDLVEQQRRMHHSLSPSHAAATLADHVKVLQDDVSLPESPRLLRVALMNGNECHNAAP